MNGLCFDGFIAGDFAEEKALHRVLSLSFPLDEKRGKEWFIVPDGFGIAEIVRRKIGSLEEAVEIDAEIEAAKSKLSGCVRVSVDIPRPVRASLKAQADKTGLKFSAWLKRLLEDAAKRKVAA